MEAKGRLLDASVDWKNGNNARAWIELQETDASTLEGYLDKDLTVKITEYRKKRSLDANAYYWVLLSKLAEAQKVSKPLCHNYILRRYGQVQMYDSHVVEVLLPESERTTCEVDEDEYNHLKPTSELIWDAYGKAKRVYIMLRGSHEYDTREMSVLLEGLITECKECGIETATPDEVKRMEEAYRERKGK